MAQTKRKAVRKKRPPAFVKAAHPVRPDWEYLLPKEDKRLMQRLLIVPIFPKTCDRPCTKIVTLFPKDTVQGH